MVGAMNARATGRREARPQRATRSGAGEGGTEPEAAPDMGFGPINAVLFAAALLVIVLGYVLLGRGSVTAAPLLLVLGYVVLIPAGLLVGMGRRDRERN